MEQFVEIFKTYSIISAFKGIPDIREAKRFHVCGYDENFKFYAKVFRNCFLFFVNSKKLILSPEQDLTYFSINWFIISYRRREND